ncbi:chalcone isomerase family protein [Reinekea marinisedimentorum]|uniref:Chalcone isomerase-like protein n=1 Tax=Reinekea marinisedimentorum TaxID=230495 RepID=A0A4R3HV60_9GAMM|nr:chalcone isomerase family protein [Reinekea marinisedimentorum]TCS37127.1 chalcone isomerase-like protein [Reinekea marinisedimentorum]
MRNLFSKLLLLAAVVLAGNALAYKPANLQLVGEATLKIMFWNVYQSRLYTPSGRFEGYNQPHAGEYMLEITYLQNIKSSDLVEQTYKQWQHLGVPQADVEPFMEELLNYWPDVSEGDTLSMHVANGRTHFYFNGVLTGEIAEPEFGPMFVSIWLSPETSQPKMRKKLLGGV